ncbi:hypothetical protein SODALDRAFT_327080 [Sodiomyces alkalinus F11]|uniref:DNA-directed RNA polymerase III complex subunit Rpc37 n=1 Tax=Sodiomyces alkalinus (strain CBS 110278 / VKM F-3762 / F11) TaxID=1314773 RepID=A0A3N2Q821_SODAK|nr:hypothetical protein SODALDRAFT_327080 [Sodiomyces alkalinus F11]ROT42914.1 hypothetical protein SODALDRAFT_327080 [Sodiomyces alkalinus F11]
MEPEESENDPIVASYDVILNPSLPGNRKLWVLQQPNRTDMNQAPPSAMRLKPRSGMVEVDIPLDYQRSYDRDKGMHWGRHLKNSLAAKNGGSHGLAGGFGIGAVPPRAKKRDEDRDDDLMMDWTEALRQDKVLRTQSLGGTCPETKEVQHMIGVFQGNELHLTPVSNLVHLRPQLHHVDAVTYQERLSTNSSSTKDGAAGGSGTGAGTGPAKAIHMTIKQGGDNEVSTTETMLDRLRAVQTEPWRQLRYTDENDEAAWDVYNESFILRHRDASKATTAEEDLPPEGTAATKEAVEEKTVHPADRAGRLYTTWGDEELLEAVSGIVKPRGPTKAELQKKAEEEAAAAAQAAREKAEMDARRAGQKTRGGAPMARGRGGRGRGAPGRGGSSVMDLT